MPEDEYFPRRTSDRTGVQALEAAVWVLYSLSKTDPVRAVGNRESRDLCAMAFEGTFLIAFPDAVKEGILEDFVEASDIFTGFLFLGS